MATVAQYLVSEANPYTVTGVGASVGSNIATAGYFASQPPTALWNTGATGVNSPISSAQLGQVPTAASYVGQLQVYTASGTPTGVNFVLGGTGEGKLLGGRFGIYLSGYGSTTTSTPTTTVYCNVNTGTTASPSPTILFQGTSPATVASTSFSWSFEYQGIFDPNSSTIYGSFNYQFAGAASGLTSAWTAWAHQSNPVTGVDSAQAQGAAGFGLVAGCSFSSGTTGNSMSLTEFKIVQES
jgi:hypothetical protein